jgi:hypothetical protein
MPLLHESSMRPGSRRGRLVFIGARCDAPSLQQHSDVSAGTGGGVPAPSPPLLSACVRALTRACSAFVSLTVFTATWAPNGR